MKLTFYRSLDPKTNIRTKNNKNFSVFFKESSSYYLYDDGAIELAKEDCGDDLKTFDEGVKLGMITKYELEVD